MLAVGVDVENDTIFYHHTLNIDLLQGFGSSRELMHLQDTP